MSEVNPVIIRPILSEKGTMLSESQNKYVFQVEKRSNKLEIAKAIEEKFKVKIKKVATLNFKGKNKNMTIRSNGKILRTNGNRANWKKAIVTLQDGFKIDILGGDV
ncbi:MAG: 50S ribosomal protein L23 [Candidatus Marinimicrobia bacterium]|jgi:large subunit ribosomal protein L23|nr:50S ribosomal protein L23 [Candidatus Neomarinimicrobiota bacterium]MDP6936299.1 50S ribosomal protein L23 [Candidatus Neomarinimicrobiota bacterium]